MIGFLNDEGAAAKIGGRAARGGVFARPGRELSWPARLCHAPQAARRDGRRQQTTVSDRIGSRLPIIRAFAHGH
jgi:hypothetical protein